MAAVNSIMFDANISAYPATGGSSMLELPLNLIAQIVSHACVLPVEPAMTTGNLQKTFSYN
jgi:hypothetical protein